MMFAFEKKGHKKKSSRALELFVLSFLSLREELVNGHAQPVIE